MDRNRVNNPRTLHKCTEVLLIPVTRFTTKAGHGLQISSKCLHLLCYLETNNNSQARPTGSLLCPHAGLGSDHPPFGEKARSLPAPRAPQHPVHGDHVLPGLWSVPEAPHLDKATQALHNHARFYILITTPAE